MVYECGYMESLLTSILDLNLEMLKIDRYCIEGISGGLQLCKYIYLHREESKNYTIIIEFLRIDIFKNVH